MNVLNTGIVAIPDIPYSWATHDLRQPVLDIEFGLGDRAAMCFMHPEKEIEYARAAHGMKALKTRKKTWVVW